MEQSGLSSRTLRMVSAKICAPPSSKSSRATDVITAWRSPIFFTAQATRMGSILSRPAGRPLFTAQKLHARVQVSPRIMNVAVREFQHSLIFGHRASSQTVCRSIPRMICLSSRYWSPSFQRTRIQSGFRSIFVAIGSDLHI